MLTIKRRAGETLILLICTSDGTIAIHLEDFAGQAKVHIDAPDAVRVLLPELLELDELDHE